MKSAVNPQSKWARRGVSSIQVPKIPRKGIATSLYVGVVLFFLAVCITAVVAQRQCAPPDTKEAAKAATGDLTAPERYAYATVPTCTAVLQPKPEPEPAVVTPRVTTEPSRSLRRSIAGVEQWRELVARYFDAAYVDDALSVMMGESGGNPNATGDAGEAGLFQLHPVHFANIAARAEGKGLSTDPWNPETNVMFAAYMSNYGRNWSAWTVQP